MDQATATNSSASKQTTGTDSCLVGSVPPFWHYLGLSFFIGFFYVVLDSNWRGNSLIYFFTLSQFLRNAAVFITFVFLIFIFIAGLVFVLEKVFALIAREILCKNDKQPDTDSVLKTASSRLLKLLPVEILIEEGNYKYVRGSFAHFVFFCIFMYINLLFFKFYIYSFLVVNYEDYYKIILVILALLVGLYIAYALKYKIEWRYENIRNFSRWFFNFSLILGGLSVITTTVLFAMDLRQPEKVKQQIGGLPNIIMLTFDSLNANNMSLYGYHRKTTPNIDKFAQECYVFEKMIANADNTQFSMQALLGGYPVLKIRNPKKFSFIDVLKKNGYRNRVFISHKVPEQFLMRQLSEITRIRKFEKSSLFKMIGRGKNRKNIDWLSDMLSEEPAYFNLFSPFHPRDYNNYTYLSSPLDLELEYVNKFLTTHKSPTFIWLHTYQPHHPFSVPPEFKGKFGTSRLDQFDASIYMVDNYLGTFLDKIKNNGIIQNSILIISSDHGQAIERKKGGSLEFVPFYTIVNRYKFHIPMLIHLPGQKEGRWIKTFAEHVDVAPTILKILGLTIPEEMEGESLVKYMENPGLLSKKMKYTIPRTYFRRKAFGDVKRSPEDTSFDMFSAFWYKYRVGWFQLYGKKFYPFQFYCIYDWSEDPREKDNLLENPEYKPLLDRVFNDPMVKEFREQTY